VLSPYFPDLLPKAIFLCTLSLPAGEAMLNSSSELIMLLCSLLEDQVTAMNVTTLGSSFTSRTLRIRKKPEFRSLQPFQMLLPGSGLNQTAFRKIPRMLSCF